MGVKPVWLPAFFKNIFFCVPQKKKMHTGLDRDEGEQMMTEFSSLGELAL